MRCDFFYFLKIYGAVSKVVLNGFVIAGLTRNPLKINVRFSGDPASSAG
jgi:hypothetical protein